MNISSSRMFGYEARIISLQQASKNEKESSDKEIIKQQAQQERQQTLMDSLEVQGKANEANLLKRGEEQYGVFNENTTDADIKEMEENRAKLNIRNNQIISTYHEAQAKAANVANEGIETAENGITIANKAGGNSGENVKIQSQILKSKARSLLSKSLTNYDDVNNYISYIKNRSFMTYAEYVEKQANSLLVSTKYVESLTNELKPKIESIKNETDEFDRLYKAYKKNNLEKQK